MHGCRPGFCGGAQCISSSGTYTRDLVLGSPTLAASVGSGPATAAAPLVLSSSDRPSSWHSNISTDIREECMPRSLGRLLWISLVGVIWAAQALAQGGA